MAIAVSSLGSQGDTNSRSASTCTITRAPAANSLVLATVVVSDTANTPVEPTGVVGVGLVFSLVTSSITYATGNVLNNLSLWRAMGATPDQSMVTATFPNNNTGCAILVDEVSGVSTAGAAGANGVGQSATSTSDLSSGLRSFGPSAASTANAWYAVHGIQDSTAGVVLDGNFTVINSGTTHDTPAVGVSSAWTTLSTGTSVRWSGPGGNFNRAGIIAELVLDNPAAPPGDVTSATGWAAAMQSLTPRVFGSRVRGDLWVQPGDVRSTSPDLDTWEG